ncbi:hypothetical protein FRC08_018430 [Ceratobasidium sp. 394]|nr:hypothetical protein FRC08_018430 [Ceratobasidium sp. 394]
MKPVLKTYKDYENDPNSKHQQIEYLLGAAEAPLPTNALDAVRLSLINGHTLFRGESGVVLEASETLNPEDRVTVVLPKDGDYAPEHPVWERVRAFKVQHAALKAHGSIQGTSKVLEEIGAQSVPPPAPKDWLKIQMMVNNVITTLNVEAGADPEATLESIRTSMKVPAETQIGFKLPGDGVRSALRSLSSGSDLAAALEILKGMVKRGRGVEKFLQIQAIKGSGTESGPQPVTSRGIARKKEVEAGLTAVPEAVKGTATLNTPPNDIRWDYDKTAPHTSSASAGSSATKLHPLGTAPSLQSIISISTSASGTSTPAQEQHDIKPSLKREASRSPDLNHSHSKRRLDEAERPNLVVREGILYPTVLTVLIELDDVLPMHAFLDYEDAMTENQIYYAPDVATLSVDWYVENLGMGRSSAVHFRDYAALLTARAIRDAI